MSNWHRFWLVKIMILTVGRFINGLQKNHCKVRDQRCPDRFYVLGSTKSPVIPGPKLAGLGSPGIIGSVGLRIILANGTFVECDSFDGMQLVFQLQRISNSALDLFCNLYFMLRYIFKYGASFRLVNTIIQ